MKSISAIGREFCQPAQTWLESKISSVPSDAVWGIAKSSLYSGSISVIFVLSSEGCITWRDIGSGIKSGMGGGVVALIYVSARTALNKVRPTTDQPGKKPVFYKTAVVSILLTVCICNWVYDYIQVQVLFARTVIGTAIPYALFADQADTPLFGTFFL